MLQVNDSTRKLIIPVNGKQRPWRHTPVQKLPESIDLDKATDAEHGLELEAQVEEVEGKEAEEVDVEGGGVHVVLPQLHRVRLEHPVLQVGWGSINFIFNIVKFSFLETKPLLATESDCYFIFFLP